MRDKSGVLDPTLPGVASSGVERAVGNGDVALILSGVEGGNGGGACSHALLVMVWLQAVKRSRLVLSVQWRAS